MTTEPIQTVIKLHADWVQGLPGGVRADLTRANLTGADLTRANLARADLYGANLADANLTGANLADANLARADLYGAKIPIITQVADIRSTVLGAVQADGCRLDMQSWHTCETTHCLAGWVVTIHPEGRLLESIYGTGAAASLILHASGESIPNFYDTSDGADERAMNWLRTGNQSDPN